MGPSGVRTDGVAGATTTGGAQNAAAAKLVNTARGYMPFHEGRNNANPFTQEVMGDANQPWCAAFVSKVLKDQNIPGVSGKMWSASASGLASQFQKEGRYFTAAQKQPQPGDVIFFGQRPGEHHVGIVQKVENGKIFTIEGNSSDKISERVYNANDPNLGFGRTLGDGQVSGDVGIQGIDATRGTASSAPSGRATGAGSYGRALDNGVDPTAYFNPTTDWMTALIRALSGNHKGAAVAALAQMFPYLSNEDLEALAAQLQQNPELGAAIQKNPELLQQLAANPDSVKQISAASRPPGWSAGENPVKGPWR